MLLEVYIAMYIKPSKLRNEVIHSMVLVNLQAVILKLSMMQMVCLNAYHNQQGD